jgi:hypothetical protein
MRQCKKCGQAKDLEEFALNRYGSKTYRRRTCRECYNAAHPKHEISGGPLHLVCNICNKCSEAKEISEFPRHRLCLYGVEHVCKACKLDRRREFAALYPERAKDVDLKGHYGITLADYHELHRKQQAKCAICGTSDEKLVVDHNHTTGQVRGLLCHLCNAMVGCARENIDILTQAIAYLYAEAHPDTAPVRAQIAFMGASAL